MQGGGRRQEVSAQKEEALIMQSAMAIAQAPLKNVAMTGMILHLPTLCLTVTAAFMLYMFGSGVQIFSIMMLGMAFWQPLKAIIDTNLCVCIAPI